MTVMSSGSASVSSDRDSAELLFRSIIEQDGVFYRNLSRDDPELENEQKLEILRNLFLLNPAIFLQRYHQFVSPCFEGLFDGNDYVTKHYLNLIKERIDAKIPGTRASKQAKNHRYLQLLKLKQEGKYFSNEKMRERAPALFDSMIGRYLSDEEKLHLRPTVERSNGVWPDLLEQFDDSGRIARRKRQMSNDWEMPCSSKEAARFMSHAGSRVAQFDELETIQGLDEEDEEALRDTFPKHISKDNVDSIMKKFKNASVEQTETIDEDQPPKRAAARAWGSLDDEPESFALPAQKGRSRIEDEDIEFAPNVGEDDSDEPGSDMEEYSSDLLKNEFTLIMETRFLDGEDVDFFDYSEKGVEDKIREQDLEDAYFADES